MKISGNLQEDLNVTATSVHGSTVRREIYYYLALIDKYLHFPIRTLTIFSGII